MRIKQIIILLLFSLLVSACDIVDSVVDTANSHLKQQEMRKLFEREQQKRKQKESEAIEKIKYSIKFDFTNKVQQHMREKNIDYDEIILQSFNIGELSEVRDFRIEFPVEVQFMLTKSTFGVKEIYKFQGRMFYSSDGVLNDMEWLYTGKTTDASELRQGIETVGKVYENLKDKNADE